MHAFKTAQNGSLTATSKANNIIPDDWGRPDGRAPLSSSLAISAYFSDRGAGTAPQY